MIEAKNKKREAEMKFSSFYELFRLSPKGNNFNGHEMKSKT